MDDRKFYEIEITRLQDRLYGAALRLTRNESEAEDLVASAALTAWRKLDQLEDRAKFSGWILRILSNTYVDILRKKQISFSEYIEDEGMVAPDEDAYIYSRLHQPFLMWYSNSEKEYVKKILRKDIEQAMDTLSENYRTIVLMVEVMGFKYCEVAEQLKIPVGTVRSRLNRGRQQLQKLLWKQAKEEGL